MEWGGGIDKLIANYIDTRYDQLTSASIQIWSLFRFLSLNPSTSEFGLKLHDVINM